MVEKPSFLLPPHPLTLLHHHLHAPPDRFLPSLSESGGGGEWRPARRRGGGENPIRRVWEPHCGRRLGGRRIALLLPPLQAVMAATLSSFHPPTPPPPRLEWHHCGRSPGAVGGGWGGGLDGEGAVMYDLPKSKMDVFSGMIDTISAAQIKAERDLPTPPQIY